MSRRNLLGAGIFGWLGFCVYIAARGVQQLGWLNYLDSGNVSSILTSSAVVSAIVWIRSDWLNRKGHQRHEESLRHLHDHHDRLHQRLDNMEGKQR